MKTKNAVTLKTIAKKVGVSVTTVTRAINGSPKSSAAMTAKVLKIADELGYVRNMEGVKLRTGKTFVLAAMLKFPSDTEIGDPTLLGILQGVHSRCAGTHYSVKVIITTSMDDELRELKQMIAGGTADGIILDHTLPQDPRVKLLLEANIPFVTFGRTELSSPHAHFDVDNEFASYQGTTELLRQGYKRIAMLDGPLDFTYVHQRIAGYKRALEKNQIPFDQQLVQTFPLKADVAKELSTRLINEQKTDAFVCANDVVLLGTCAAVREHMKTSGQKFGLSVRGGTELGAYLDLKPAISFYSRVDAGWNLADLLLKCIDGEPVEKLNLIAKTELR